MAANGRITAAPIDQSWRRGLRFWQLWELAGLDGYASDSMAIQVLTQQDVRPLRRLPFCYICGRQFSPDDVQNDDHVPPTSLFLEADRNHPLILPTHYDCNHGRHVEDQQIGQLIGLLHGDAPNPQHQRIQLFGGQGPDGNPFAAAGGLDLTAIIRRWVRGFHAALYREPMADGTQFMTSPPLASADMDTGQVDPVHDIVPHFVRAIRQNREGGPLDRIVCRNGKCALVRVGGTGDGPKWCRPRSICTVGSRSATSSGLGAAAASARTSLPLGRRPPAPGSGSKAMTHS